MKTVSCATTMWYMRLRGITRLDSDTSTDPE